MKRSPELAPLSREHHHALDIARRMRRATPEDLEDVLARFRRFWQLEALHHFELEERELVPELCGDPAWAAGLQRMRDEHVELRSRGESVSDLESAHGLGELLNAHVRFEERELFGIIEDALSPDELARLGAALAED
jgi:hypothetical protein